MGMEQKIRDAVLKYSDMLYKICIVILCNEQDAQDAIQDTFCRYLEKKPHFLTGMMKMHKDHLD